MIEVAQGFQKSSQNKHTTDTYIMLVWNVRRQRVSVCVCGLEMLKTTYATSNNSFSKASQWFLMILDAK